MSPCLSWLTHVSWGSLSASPGHSHSSPCGPLQLQSQGVMELQALSLFQSFRAQLIRSGPPRPSPCHEVRVGRTLITPVKSLHSTICIRVWLNNQKKMCVQYYKNSCYTPFHHRSNQLDAAKRPSQIDLCYSRFFHGAFSSFTVFLRFLWLFKWWG